jgi:hypothetical protein
MRNSYSRQRDHILELYRLGATVRLKTGDSFWWETSPQVEELSIPQPTVPPFLASFSSLRRLRVGGWKGRAALIAALPALQELDASLPVGGITDEDLEGLCSASLKRFVVVDCPLTDRVFRSLARVPNLERVTLNRTDIRGSELAELSGLAKLHYLDLSNSASANDESIHGLSRLIGLQVLVLNDTDIGTSVVEQTARLPELIGLSLSDCQRIDDADIERLASIHTLSRIELARTRITDRALRSLAEMPIDQLELAGCKNITPEGVRALATSRTLKSIDLTDAPADCPEVRKILSARNILVRRLAPLPDSL